MSFDERLNRVAIHEGASRLNNGNVRFGSKVGICDATRHVRFTPESGHLQRKRACPLWANSGHKRASALLFDHFIRAREQRQRYGKTEGLRSLEIYHRLVLCRGLQSGAVQITDEINGCGKPVTLI